MKRFKQIIFSDFFDTLTNGALVLFAYWYIYDVTHNQNYISLLGLISMLATLFTFIGGYFSDRMNRIALLKIVVLIRILNTSFGLVIYLLMNNPILGVMMTVVINSVLNIVYSPLTESIVPSIVHDRDDLVTANSWVSITNQLASVLSAGLSAIFIFFGSVGAGLVLSLILYSVSYFLIGRLNSTQAPEANHEASSSLSIQTSNFFEGIKIIRSNTLIAVIVPIALVTNFCFWTVWLLMPKFTVGSILGAFLVNAKHSDTKIFTAKSFPYFLFLQGFMILLIGFFSLLQRGIFGVVLAWLGYGICNATGSILYFSTVQLSVPNQHIGMVIGAILTIFSVANPIAAIASAPLSHLAATPSIVLCLGLVMMIAAIPVFSKKVISDLIKVDAD